jgi:hypothetical protein
MHRLFFTVTGLLVTALIIAGCVTRPIDTSRAAQYKRIGVLSAMGDRFSVGRVGITIFTTGGTEGELDLGTDDFITQQAMTALSQRYQVVDLSKYRKAFLDRPKHWPGEQGVFAEKNPPVPEVVRELMGEEKLDAYVLITPGYGSVRGTNQSVAGIGLLKKEELLRTGDVRLYVSYIVSVIDGIDYSVQADMRAYPDGETPMGFLGHSSSLSSPSWPVLPQFLNDPASARDQLRSAMEMLLTQNVPQTLRQAKLTD